MLQGPFPSRTLLHAPEAFKSGFLTCRFAGVDRNISPAWPRAHPPYGREGPQTLEV